MNETLALTAPRGVAQVLRSEFRHLDLPEALKLPVRALIGVSADAVAALALLDLHTVFDLGSAAAFRDATLVATAGADAGHPLQRFGVFPSDLVRENLVQDQPLEAYPLAPVSLLRAIPLAQADAIAKALDVANVRELSLYAPYVAARSLVQAQLMPASVPGVDAEAPADLLPRNGDYPTERVHYTTLVMGELAEPDAGAVDIDSAAFKPLSLDAVVQGDSGFKRVAYGALLTFSQSWYAQGVALGQLLHSAALAPGESTRIAVIDWTRKSRAGQTEVIDEVDDLRNDQSHNRSISEVTSAVARESQGGFSRANTQSSSSQFGTAASLDISAPLGGLLGGPSGSAAMSASSAQSASSAESYSTSWGSRDVGSKMMQNVADSTHQNAHSSRSRRASVVKEVSQSEHESVSTRVITNYNHMHALTVQYYEVVQIYRVEVTLTQAERVVFIPVELVDFNRDAMVRRFRNVLMQAALNSEVVDALRNLDLIEIAPERNTPFTGLGGKLSVFIRDAVFLKRPLVSPAVLASASAGAAAPAADAPAAAAPAPAPAPAPAAPASQPLTRPQAALAAATRIPLSVATPLAAQISEKLWSTDQVARLSSLLDRAVLQRGSSALYVPTDVAIEGVAVTGGSVSVVFTTKSGGRVTTVSPSQPLQLAEVSRISISGSRADADIPEAIVVLTLNRNGVRFPLELPAVTVTKGASTTAVVTLKAGGVNTNLKQHLTEHRLHYSQAVLRSLSASDIALLLSGHRVKIAGQLVPVAQVVEPRPIRYVGNFLAFKMNVDAASDEAWARFLREYRIVVGKSHADLVPLGSGGTFAEAVLGRYNSAEKLDMTRFWNWQDSPLPIVPTEIAAIQTGSRATAEDVKPGQLSAPIIAMGAPTALPDPVGTAAILSAIQNGNMFRDMSGLQAVVGLAQSALQASAAGAAQAGQQAGTNQQNQLQATTERQRIAADLVKSVLPAILGAATGVPLGGGGGGGTTPSSHSQDGAKVNYFDKAKAAATEAGTSGGGGAASPGAQPSSAGGSVPGSDNPAAMKAVWGQAGASQADLFDRVSDKVLPETLGRGSPDNGAAATSSFSFTPGTKTSTLPMANPNYRNKVTLKEVTTEDTVVLSASNSSVDAIEFRFKSLNLANMTASPSDAKTAVVLLAPGAADVPIATFTITDRSKAPSLGYDASVTAGNSKAVFDGTLCALPWASGGAFKVAQGFGGTSSHGDAQNFHAVDITMPIGTPVHAARGGVVVATEQGFDNGTGIEAKANYVVICHADGSYGQYWHLDQNGVVATVGTTVAEGAHIGNSGNSGKSTGPHLHFSVAVADGTGKNKTVPWKFKDGAGNGFEPVAGQTYTKP